MGTRHSRSSLFSHRAITREAVSRRECEGWSQEPVSPFGSDVLTPPCPVFGSEMLRFVVRNTCWAFVCISGPEPLKPVKFPVWEEDEGVSFPNKPLPTTSETPFGKLLRMRLVAREANHVTRALVLCAPPPGPWGRSEGLEVDFSHQGQ